MLRIIILLAFFLFSLPYSLAAAEKIGDCLECHQKTTRGIFQAWVNSQHAKNGVDCITCHENMEKARAIKSAVDPKLCAQCHPDPYDQFQQGRHSIAWDRMKEHPQYRILSDPLKRAFCESCHAVQNKCNTCHTAHGDTPGKAREPESCKKCHTGLAGPHDEMYASSLHGTIYAQEKNSGRAPTCASCHMVQGTHNSSFGIIYDSWGEAVNKNGKPLTPAEQAEARKQMLEGACYQCHIPSLTRERFELADQVKQKAKELLLEAEKVIQDLEKEGILPGGGPLGKGQLYQETSRIENLYYRMFQFHNIYTWKGAYHFSADFSHWYGWANLQMSLIEIKEEARKLREMRKTKK